MIGLELVGVAIGVGEGVGVAVGVGLTTATIGVALGLATATSQLATGSVLVSPLGWSSEAGAQAYGSAGPGR